MQDHAAGTLEPGIGGVTITVTWSGPDGELGTVDDVPLPAAVTDAEGHYLVTHLPGGLALVEMAAIPGYRELGPVRHLVELLPHDADVGVAGSILSADFPVIPAAMATPQQTATPETLPRTGASAAETTRAALILLAVGAVLVLVGRRRIRPSGPDA